MGADRWRLDGQVALVTGASSSPAIARPMPANCWRSAPT